MIYVVTKVGWCFGQAMELLRILGYDWKQIRWCKTGNETLDLAHCKVVVVELERSEIPIWYFMRLQKYGCTFLGLEDLKDELARRDSKTIGRA